MKKILIAIFVYPIWLVIIVALFTFWFLAKILRIVASKIANVLGFVFLGWLDSD